MNRVVFQKGTQHFWNCVVSEETFAVQLSCQLSPYLFSIKLVNAVHKIILTTKTTMIIIIVIFNNNKRILKIAKNAAGNTTALFLPANCTLLLLQDNNPTDIWRCLCRILTDFQSSFNCCKRITINATVTPSLPCKLLLIRYVRVLRIPSVMLSAHFSDRLYDEGSHLIHVIATWKILHALVRNFVLFTLVKLYANRFEIRLGHHQTSKRCLL